MCRSATVLVLLVAALPRAAVSQQGAPLVSLTAGAGHPFGGFGLQGEMLLADGRLGIIGGAASCRVFIISNHRSPAPLASGITLLDRSTGSTPTPLSHCCAPTTS